MINAGDSSSISSDPLRISTASTEVDEPSEVTWKSAQTSNSPVLSICDLSRGLSLPASPVDSNQSRTMGTGTVELDLKDNATEVESSASAGLEDRILGSLREQSGPEGGVLWDALTRGFIVGPEGYVSTKEIKCKVVEDSGGRRDVIITRYQPTVARDVNILVVVSGCTSFARPRTRSTRSCVIRRHNAPASNSLVTRRNEALACS